jgi:signal transduction histidine kinase
MSTRPATPLLTPLTRAGYWIAYLSPILGLIGLALVDRLLLVRFWPEQRADAVIFVLTIVLTLLYSHGFLTRIKAQYAELARLLATTEQQRDRLRLLQEAMTTIAEDRDWEGILQRVVQLSRELTGARYGALAVLNPDETIARFITSGLTPEQIRAIGSLPRGRGLLGEVIRTRRPLRVANIREHPASVGWPPNHPEMTSFLGMPVLFRDQVVGHLYLTDKAQGPFTEDDEELVALLAGQAAVLISNARLNSELERLAVIEERQRIGMDLHDGTIQSLYGVMLTIDTLLPKIPPEQQELRDVLDDLGDRLSRITSDIRHYIFDLKQEQQDWLQSVNAIVAELGLKGMTRIHTSDRQYDQLSPRQRDNVLAWIREALTNVARHAHADRIEITWRGEDERFRITVEDNGVGFAPDAAVAPGHFGLKHLAQRAEELGGQFAVRSRPGAGTVVELVAPFVPPGHEPAGGVRVAGS